VEPVNGERILHKDDRPADFVGQDDRYRLIRLVGEDRLGQVWHGEDTLVRAAVTIRLVSQSLTQDPDRIDAFRRQLKALYPRLAHPNIAWVYYYNSGEDGPIEFVVMAERGQTLAQRLKRGPGVHPREGFAIGAAIAEGLQAAHDLGFVHGALTTHSVMLSDDGSVKIMDFGTGALRLDPDRDTDPEGPARDVQALAKILRRMAGPRSSSGGASESASAWRKGVGVDLVRLWKASLDPDPGRRPSAESLAFALRDAAKGATRSVQPFEAAETPPQAEPNPPVTDDPPVPEGSVDERAQQERTVATEEVRGEAPRDVAPVAEPVDSLTPSGAAAEVEQVRREVNGAEEARKAEAVRLAGEATGAEETAKRDEQGRQLDDARKASKAARAEHAGLNEGARRGEEAARGKEEQASAVTERGAPPGGRARAPRAGPQTGSQAESALPPARSVMASSGPSAPMRAARGWSSTGFLPRGRSWLWLGGVILVTATLLFLLTRPVAEPDRKQSPQSVPRDTTGSEAIVMPDLRGFTYADALTRLEATSLSLARRVEVEGEPGIVIATDPSLGQPVRPGTAVTVYVGAVPPDEAAVDSF
jgi:hypothetical protein